MPRSAIAAVHRPHVMCEVVTPRGAGSDDAPNLLKALTRMAYRGRVFMAPGNWTIGSRWTFPNGGHLEISQGATVNVTLGRTGAIPYTAAFFSEGEDAADLTTLSAPAATGDTAITVTSAAGISVGNRLKIRLTAGGVYLCIREVIAKDGTTLTIDRPLARPYASGSGIAVVGTSRDITIRGNGALVTGEADAIVQFTACWNVHVSDLFVEADTQAAFVYDVGSRDSTMARLTIDGLGTSTHAFIIDTDENIALEDCSSTRFANENIHWASNDNCTIRGGSHSQAGDNVLRLTVRDVNDPYGCRGCTFHGVKFGTSDAAAVLIQNGSSGNSFYGCEAEFGTVGLSFASGAVGNGWYGGRLRGNTQRQISAAGSGCLGNKVVGALVHEYASGVAQVSAGADLELDGVTVVDTSSASVTAPMLEVTGANSVARVHGGRWSTGRNACHGAVLQTASARLYVDGGWKYIGTGTNDAAVLVNAGEARIESMVAISAGGFGVWANGATGTARVGSGADMSGCGTPTRETNSGTVEVATWP